MDIYVYIYIYIHIYVGLQSFYATEEFDCAVAELPDVVDGFQLSFSCLGSGNGSMGSSSKFDALFSKCSQRSDIQPCQA